MGAGVVEIPGTCSTKNSVVLRYLHGNSLLIEVVEAAPDFVGKVAHQMYLWCLRYLSCFKRLAFTRVLFLGAKRFITVPQA